MTARFHARTIDDAPQLLEESYRLRYQVYCLERRFLRAEDYPNQLEVDEFDRHSIHVGAVDMHGKLAGTARVVKVTDAGLPLLRHCTIYPAKADLFGSRDRVVEVSRMAVSRHYSRRRDDGFYGVPEQSGAVLIPAVRGRERRHVNAGGLVFLTLLKAVYQATKRMEMAHCLAGIEKSLHRILAQYGFPFRLIGPEGHYFGVVAPYALDLKEFDNVILSRRFPVLDEFIVGLEPEFRPRPDRAA
jgi:N-acyl amino acid synthase of PEP-CTERM/exosortase system